MTSATLKHRRRDGTDCQRTQQYVVRPNLRTIDRHCPACERSVTLGRIGGRDSTKYQAVCQCGLEIRAVWPGIVFGYREPANPQHRNGTLEADEEAMPDFEVYA